jgi:hypothetical protein
VTCVSVFFTSLCKLGPEVALRESHTTDRAIETPTAPFTILLTAPFPQFVDCTNPLAPKPTQSESRPHSELNIKETEERSKPDAAASSITAAVVADTAKVGDRPKNRRASINARARVGGHKQKGERTVREGESGAANARLDVSASTRSTQHNVADINPKHRGVKTDGARSYSSYSSKSTQEGQHTTHKRLVTKL